MTPPETEAELERLSSRLEAKSNVLGTLLRKAAEADVAYRVAYAKAMLVAQEKTVAERESWATVQCEALLLERKISEAIADACRESVRSIREQLQAMRSINSNARTMSGL
jgi:hypothetical protein